MTAKTTTVDPSPKLLILGIGNLLMGDEGVGVHAVRLLQQSALPPQSECLEGGTGSFQLLGPMLEASRIILIDATVDGFPPGTIRRLCPRFSTDYPRTLTAHDIGLKDLLDAFHLLGDAPEVTLFAVSIDSLRDLSTELTPVISGILPQLADRVLDEVWKGHPRRPHVARASLPVIPPVPASTRYE